MILDLFVEIAFTSLCEKGASHVGCILQKYVRPKMCASGVYPINSHAPYSSTHMPRTSV